MSYNFKTGRLITFETKERGFSLSYPKEGKPEAIRTGLPKNTWTEFKKFAMNDLNGEMLGVDQTLHKTAIKNLRKDLNLK